VSNKDIRKILCAIMGVKSARKLRDMKPQEFKVLTMLFGDVWGLTDEKPTTPSE
jgi:hypothetical protein